MRRQIGRIVPFGDGWESRVHKPLNSEKGTLLVAKRAPFPWPKCRNY